MNSVSPIAEPRLLWQPVHDEQMQAMEAALCGDLSLEARRTIRDRVNDWFAHAQGCRRRAHEYKRWALEYEAAGNLPRYREYRAKSDKSWAWAKEALVFARREKIALNNGEKQWP